jgi:hypothetical protein
VEKIETHLAVLQKMDWAAIKSFPVQTQMTALETELNILASVLNQHKNALHQRHHKDSVEARTSSAAAPTLHCIQQSDVSMVLNDGESYP